jgi:hypothetical protein
VNKKTECENKNHHWECIEIIQDGFYEGYCIICALYDEEGWEEII